jgi:hypothetical protein
MFNPSELQIHVKILFLSYISEEAEEAFAKEAVLTFMKTS